MNRVPVSVLVGCQLLTIFLRLLESPTIYPSSNEVERKPPRELYRVHYDVNEEIKNNLRDDLFCWLNTHHVTLRQGSLALTRFYGENSTTYRKKEKRKDYTAPVESVRQRLTSGRTKHGA